jgi:branched-subunit amino acid aminotransferase/4-amino-4-deoxychorismate lyase
VRDPLEPSGVRVVLLMEHIERLRGSAKELGLSDSLRPEALADAVLAAAAKADLDRARVRLTITGGDLNLLEAGAGTGPVDPTVLIAVTPAQAYPDAMFDRGVGVTIADWKANPLDGFQGHKTVWYWPRLQELQKAAAKGAGEALVFGVSNHAVGGCVSNLVCVKGGEIVTPVARGEEQQGAMPSPVLPGCTRHWLLDRADDLGVVIHRRMVTIDDVLDADEVFLTNASWGVLPVVRVESREIGEAKPGGLTRRLLAEWRSFVEGNETGEGGV